MNMLIGLWFLVPTVVTGYECTYYQYNTINEQSDISPNSTSEVFQDEHHYDVLISDESSSILSQFWKNTGFCPPDPHEESYKYFISNDMKQNLFHIGSLPFKGLTRVRMHWLLDLVQMHIKPDSSVLYNFTYLDQLVYEFWKNGLFIGFEIMGNPSNYFSDFENVTQVYMWKNLVQAIAEHYIDLYGIEYLMEWNFETWNEPDHHDFDNLNFTVHGFLNYYDACSEGLKQADERLRFGGPGGSCRIPGKGHSPICWALLDHCIRGRNFFTGEIGSRLDFISFHKKGNASSLLILNEEWETIQYMRNEKKIPQNIHFYNDEADPMKNWALPQQWRSDVTYAAMVVKIILSHIQLYYMQNETRYIDFSLLSNDNAFLSYFPYQFSQRTLLARFQVNNTRPKYVEYVKKPVFTIFGLLSQLCHKSLHSQAYQDGEKMKYSDEFGVVATHCFPRRNQIVLIMYNSADSFLSNVTFDIHIFLNLSKFNKVADARWVALELNNRDANPYLRWKNAGMPVYPTTEQFSFIKSKEEPDINGPWKMRGFSPFVFHLKILNPGVTLINICGSRSKLKKVVKVRFFQVRNSSLYISWTDKRNRCILTYNIEYSSNSSGPYTKLNHKSVTFPSYWHSCRKNDINCSIVGFYRISAIDYWYVRGPFSKPTKYKD